MLGILKWCNHGSFMSEHFAKYLYWCPSYWIGRSSEAYSANADIGCHFVDLWIYVFWKFITRILYENSNTWWQNSKLLINVLCSAVTLCNRILNARVVLNRWNSRIFCWNHSQMNDNGNHSIWRSLWCQF